MVETELKTAGLRGKPFHVSRVTDLFTGMLSLKISMKLAPGETVQHFPQSLQKDLRILALTEKQGVGYASAAPGNEPSRSLELAS